VLEGKRFMSASLKGRDSSAPAAESATVMADCHDVASYPDNTSLVDGYALGDSIPQASLQSILCTEELQRRPSRSPDYEKENRALVALVSALADSPRTILQTLAETILDITQCDSAGLSLLTRDGKTPDVSGPRFYWPAIVGMWNPHVGGGTPRNFGPCGDVLDQNRTLLFRHFERRYPYLLPVVPAAEECLLVPFHVHGKAVGTIWAIMHSDRRKFDAEDDRCMASLGKFASSAYQALVRIDDVRFQVAGREKAEAELRKLTDGLEVSCIGTFEWNIRTGVNTWTPELEAMYGLPPGGFGGTQAAFENLVHSDDRARVINLCDDAMKTGQQTGGEWRVVWPDGSVHWIAGRWQVFMSESGEPSRMIGINMDITVRKLAELELATTSERLNLALESGSVGGWDYNLKTGRNVWFGKAHAQLGLSPDETSGSLQEFWDFVHEGDREKLRYAIQAAGVKHEEFNEDFRVVWKDGTTHWLRARGRYHYTENGEPERMLGISIDITESKRAEQALRESEQRLKLAMQVGRMYAYDWDVTKGAVVRSSEHVQIPGLAELSPHQEFVDKIHPDDRTRFLAAVAGLAPESPISEVTYRALSPDGTLVWLKSNGRAFFDAEAKMLRVIGMVADISDIKRAEEGLAGMTRKLVEAQEQERARIARDLHDDINQRLAMLAMELEQLQDNPSDVTSRVQEFRKQVIEISNGVQSLSHDLHSSQLEYLGVVAGMRGWCKEFGKRRKFEVDFKSDVASVVPPQIGLCLFRVLQEALHNAVKHSGVRRFEVQLQEEFGEIHLVISDSGKGFDVQAAWQGKGLGLTSMRERVRLVNGTITIESQPMGGTTIHARVSLGSEKLSKRAVPQYPSP
jgi:PAS domain S-box-containing protein